MPTDLTGLLRRTDLLGSAPAVDLRTVAAASRVRRFRRGQVVFSAGDPGDTLLVVVSGRIKVVVHAADGGELTLTIVQPGGVCGERTPADPGSPSPPPPTPQPPHPPP